MSNYPAIPEPKEDLKSLLASVKALKEAVEILANLRGDSMAAAVTNGQMIRLGKFSQDQVPRNKPASRR